MRYIKYKLILRRRENIMHGNLCLHHTEIWTKVTADFSQPVKQCLSDFRSKFLQLLKYLKIYACGANMFMKIMQ